MRPVHLLTALLFCGFHHPATAEPAWQPLWDGDTPGPSIVEKQDTLKEGGRLTRIARPEIQVWQPAGAPATPRPALLVFPGGGYAILAMDHEGRQVAEWAAGMGMVAVVVKYRVSDRESDRYTAPWPLVDARRAVATVRHKAAAWGIDPAKIGVIGFSAGGHLAAMTAFTEPPAEGGNKDAVDTTSARPDFAMLVYPVISMDKPYTHEGSRRQLLGKEPAVPILEAHNPARFMSKSSPPVFLAHAADDRVSALNSFDLARAATEAGVPVEFHLYPSGGHGFGMKKQSKPTDDWTRAAEAWLRGRGILGPEP